MAILTIGRLRPQALPESVGAVRAALTWWSLTRPTMLAVGYLAILVLGYGPPDSVTSQRIYDGDLLNLPARWDAMFYHDIATRGYNWNGSNVDGQSVAYFPGFPLAMRGVASISGLPALWAGIVVSLIAFLGALVYLYRLARDLLDEMTARWSVILLSTYPGAAFFSAPYTESLFLLAALGAFHHLRQRQLWIATAWLAVAGLTRVQGFLLAVPVAVMVWRDRDGQLVSSPREWIRGSVTVLAPLLGVVLFSAYLQLTFDRPLLWLENQVGWGPPIYADLLQGRLPPAVPSAHPVTVLDRVSEGFNWGATAFALALIPTVWRSLGVEYVLFLAVCVFPPLLGHGFFGMARYTAVVFPMFIALAGALAAAQRVYAVAAGFFVGQLYAAAMFFTWRHFM